MTKTKKQHPIWIYFPSNDLTNSYICSQYSTKIRSGKGKTRQKIVSYNKTEGSSTSLFINTKLKNETLEYLQLEDQFQDNNKRTLIST
ncbi:9167_t:CDS:2 [Cetraspora pellucida]|uniref:9167_t:CDS:1 n=1 Tax=Cetraspora pellucida TaxID=1433469 RepID=A0A9N9NAK1_9GLOM|nr:9167_t:CDS:2 [Cetraspora pellucida]